MSSYTEEMATLELHPDIGEVVQENSSKPCSICGKADPEFECWPCRCNVFCKKCAMKLATGGKCKTCKVLFSSMTHIGVNPEIEEAEES